MKNKSMKTELLIHTVSELGLTDTKTLLFGSLHQISGDFHCQCYPCFRHVAAAFLSNFIVIQVITIILHINMTARKV